MTRFEGDNQPVSKVHALHKTFSEDLIINPSLLIPRRARKAKYGEAGKCFVVLSGRSTLYESYRTSTSFADSGRELDKNQHNKNDMDV